MRSLLITTLMALAGVIGATATIPALATASSATPTVTNSPQAAKSAITVTGAVSESTPDAVLSAATRVVTNRLKEDSALPKKSTTTIDELMETTILPLFDFRHMTQLAVARNWKLTSPAQQEALIAEFKTLLVRTYYAALVNYRDEVIEYKPLQLAAGDTDVTVKSTVKKPGVERMTIDYDMQKNVDGWKVYDIRIAGISLTTNYRSSFAEIIRDGGVDELIRFLVIKNRQSRSGLRSDNSETRGIILLYGVAPNLLRGIQ